MATEPAPNVNPWAKYRSQTWTESFPGLFEEEITFRDTGSGAALVDIMFGGLFGADKDRALCQLVVSSIIDPVMTEADYNALPLGHRVALFSAILGHVNAGTGARTGFPQTGSGPTSETGSNEPATVNPQAPEVVEADGGSGEPQKLSVSVRRKDS